MPLKTTAEYPGGVATTNAIIDLLKTHGHEIDALFWALPNLPVEFFADTLSQIMTETSFEGVCVDALKRTEAVERVMSLNNNAKQRHILYITGAGATPGFLTTMAAVAAQSFTEVTAVDIHFGVGIACWESYKSTIREDIIHMDGFNADTVAKMSDEEIETVLRERNGLIQLTNMEHADDVILELAGVCPRENVTVGGLVDTTQAKKPCSTTVTVTGRTVSGAMGSHQIVLSDETTMVDNVCGPALGFLLRGQSLYNQGLRGIISSADIMPRYATRVPTSSSTRSAHTNETVTA
jgi:hypothetical protein